MSSRVVRAIVLVSALPLLAGACRSYRPASEAPQAASVSGSTLRLRWEAPATVVLRSGTGDSVATAVVRELTGRAILLSPDSVALEISRGRDAVDRTFAPARGSVVRLALGPGMAVEVERPDPEASWRVVKALALAAGLVAAGYWLWRNWYTGI